MTIKKIKSGEATFISEQKFMTAEDAYEGKDPISEEQITVQDVKIDKTIIKKEVTIDVTRQQDRETK
jgi:hypothetical protein